MAILFRSSDKITCKIDGVTLKVSPLTFQQKAEISSTYTMSAGEMVADHFKRTFLAIKYAVKEASGIELVDGSEYKVELSESGVLTDECVDDLLNLEIGPKLMQACANLINGVTSELNNIEGVKFDLPKPAKSKKK